MEASIKVFVLCFTVCLTSLKNGACATSELRVNSTYYSYVVHTDGRALEFWEPLDDQQETYSLVNATSLAYLRFNFPFYGHLVPNLTVVKNGFLYMGRTIHPYLTATEYIAPLMAAFNMSTLESKVLYRSTQDQFVAQWKDVFLTDQPDAGVFSFQTTLYRNGTVAFIYKQIPINVTSIQERSHPVKIGLSNAFRIFTSPTSASFYEYDRISVNSTYIQTGNVIIFTPNTTCNMMETCSTCVSHSTLCKWCGTISRCSDDGKDWHRQEWENASCPQNAIQTCPVQSEDPERNDGESNNQTTTTTPPIPTAIVNTPVDGTPRPVTSFSGATTEIIPATIAPGDQLNLEIDNIGSRSVDISWTPAVDSEFPVQYVVQLRTSVTSWYNHTYGAVKVVAGRRSTTISTLIASTVYNIRMFAYIELGRTGYTTVIAFQTTSSEDDTSNTNTLPSSLFPIILSIIFSRHIKDLI